MTNINTYLKKLGDLLYTLYNNFIQLLEFFLIELLRIVRIISYFLSSFYNEINSLFSISLILKLLIQLAFISKVILTIPFLPVSLELKTLATDYISSLIVVYSWGANMFQELLDYYKNNNSTFLNNELLEKDIEQLRNQVKLEQDKNNLLTLANNELSQQLYKEKTATQFDQFARWLSIGSSTILFISSVTNLSLNVYRIINGNFNIEGSNSELKKAIDDILKILIMQNRSEIEKIAEKRQSTGAPGIAPGSIPFDDIDDADQYIFKLNDYESYRKKNN